MNIPNSGTHREGDNNSPKSVHFVNRSMSKEEDIRSHQDNDQTSQTRDGIQTMVGRASSYNQESIRRMMRILVFYCLFLLNVDFRGLKQTPKAATAFDDGTQPQNAEQNPPSLRKEIEFNVVAKKVEQTLLMDSVEVLWGDLNLSSTVNCGVHKCFIPSISDSEVGYIINAAEGGNLNNMIKATEYAQEIERKYGAKNFYIADEIPFVSSMPDETRSRVNAKIAKNPEGDTNFFKSPSVVVQKTKAAEDSSLLLKFCTCRFEGEAQLPSFVSNVMAKIGGKSEFELMVAKERYMLYMMLIDMPDQFGIDLQAFVSTKGEFFFIDLGGHADFSTKPKWKKMMGVGIDNDEFCGKMFDDIIEALNKQAVVLGSNK